MPVSTCSSACSSDRNACVVVGSMQAHGERVRQARLQKQAHVHAHVHASMPTMSRSPNSSIISKSLVGPERPGRC